MLLAYLALGALSRLVLWASFGLVAGVNWLQLPRILVAGVLNDVAPAACLLLPLTAFLWLLPESFQARPAGRRLLAGGLLLMLFAMLFIASLEYFFFEEFDARFNLVAVDYLIYPTEVIGDIQAEYPVFSLSLALLGIAAILLRLLWPRLLPLRGKTRKWHTHTVLPAAQILMFGGLTMLVPVDRPSGFDNRVADELAANGPAKFFSAMLTNQLDYPSFYRTGDTAELRRLLAADLASGGGQFINPLAGDLTRRFESRADGLGRLNVVLIAEESFGAEFVGAYGDSRGLTPEFDQLARQGLLFTHAYASGTRTVRGLEAFSASFPPIPSESILKRPGNEDIATWGKVMRELGYHTSFLYGGFGAFDNMNHYFGRNGFALSDRSDIVSPQSANIWGVSDGDLFRHALQYFDGRAKAGKPFFSIVMSTSNHKPYTFPAGIPGVKAAGGGRVDGIRYADYALGEFMREARRHAWFKDTLFVIAADHGARVYGRAEIPLHSYEIPMLMLAPEHVRPRRVEARFSQIDVAPTVLGMLGLAYQAPFFGQDVLHLPKDQVRTLLFNHNHNVAALRGDEMCILGLHKISQCLRYERLPGAPGPATTQFTATAPDPALLDLATAYYQTAYELFQSRQYH